MVICKYCKREMTTNTGCLMNALSIGQGKGMVRKVKNTEDKCNYCGASKGAYHHEGCYMERCPKCGHQLISCDCGWEIVARNPKWDL